MLEARPETPLAAEANHACDTLDLDDLTAGHGRSCRGGLCGGRDDREVGPTGQNRNLVDRESLAVNVKVDGAATPELIPNAVAYGLLFRVLGDKPGRLEEPRTRAYLKAMGLLKTQCVGCAPVPQHVGAELDETQLAEFGKVLDEYRQRLRVFSTRAREIRTSANAGVELRQLQDEKSAYIADIVRELPTRIGPHSAAAVDAFVEAHLKKRIKILSSK